MQETTFQFGPDNGLMGVLTTPDPSVRISGAPTAILLNAGIVHRVGPFRLHVDIARQLAAAGFSALRIDLSGLGDSLPRTEKLNGEQRPTLDVADAMESLQRHHDCQQFVLLGLCSGAFNAHQIAVEDSRVIGTVFIDGIVFPTLGYFWRHTIGRLLRPRFYRNAIKRRSLNRDNAPSIESAGVELAESEFFFANDIDRQSVTDDLNTMIQRDVRMLFVYTDGYQDVCGRQQFKEMFGIVPDDQVQVEYFKQSEHTFSVVEHRVAVCQRITDWYQQQFSGAADQTSVAGDLVSN